MELNESIQKLSLNDNQKADVIEINKCYYCKIVNEDCIVKCNNCSIFFCNGKGQLDCSHIFNHLVRAGHNKVDFILKKVKGNAKSCNSCGSENIFDLGYLTSDCSNRYLLCRPPCRYIEDISINNKIQSVTKLVFKNCDEYFNNLEQKLPDLCIDGKEILKNEGNIKFDFTSGKLESINISEWKPLITSNKTLIELLVKQPNYFENMECQKVTAEEAEKIEKELDLKRATKFGTVLINEDSLIVDKKVLLNYENKTEFYEIFSDLMRHEFITKLIQEKKKGEDDFGLRVSYERTLDAMKIFKTNETKINDDICQIILGKKKIELPESNHEFSIDDYQAPNLPVLNQSQLLAIKHALENPFTLIQGPPGTGKTITSATIVYNLFKRESGQNKILVCAPSNYACDNLASKIKQTNLNVVRLLSRKKEEDETYFSPLSLHNLMKHQDLDSPFAKFLQDLKDRLRTIGRPEIIDDVMMKKAKNYFSNIILDKADVIVVTCVTSADRRLTGKKFNFLLIDEVTQANEPEIIIPISKDIQKVILVGDIQQLSPVVENKEAASAGYNQSMMQRLTALNNSTFMLNQQYRMHPMIAKFSGENFYDGKLKNGVTEKDRILTNSTFKWPNDKPIFFFSTREEEQIYSTGHSYLNVKEGYTIGNLIAQLINSGIETHQIAVITPYKGQTEYLKVNLKFFGKNVHDYDKIEIASINAYQGKEKDIVILSTVRSNSFNGKRSIGFLSDTRRLNVALTRAKYGLIIVGDEQTLCKNEAWYKLLKFYQDHKVIFKGSIIDPIQFNSNLPEPQEKDLNEQTFKLENNYYIKLNDVKLGNETIKYQKIDFSV